MIKYIPPVVRGAFGYDADVVSLETGFVDESPSLTQQSFKDECDINTIVRRFGLSGAMPEPLAPQYGDFSDAVDFHSAMNAVRSASEGFMTLPADMRKRFDNDPANLIRFLQDDANRPEAIALGLVDAPPSPPFVPPVSPPSEVS